MYGYNLFNCIEIGDPQWLNRYADRMAFGGCLNKVQEFNNLSFDGGYLPSTQPAPLGWSQPDIYGGLVASAKFGNAYYIKNTSGGPLSVAGLITQKRLSGRVSSAHHSNQYDLFGARLLPHSIRHDGRHAERATDGRRRGLRLFCGAVLGDDDQLCVLFRNAA